LEKKIQDLKKNLDESKVLKEEAEKLYNEQLSKQKENSIIIKRIEEGTKKEIKDIKQNIEKEIELSMLRKIKNYDQISTQMENDLRENLKNEIMEKVTLYTEARIRKNLLDKHNNKFVKDSLKKIPKQLS
jgi:F0F1-type ATP synthase membrane subunit b/b'